jgi:hypothetical protein
MCIKLALVRKCPTPQAASASLPSLTGHVYFFVHVEHDHMMSDLKVATSNDFFYLALTGAH